MRCRTMLWTFALVVLLGSGVAAADAASLRTAVNPTLDVTFNPNHTATMSLPDGTPVGTLSGTPTVIPYGTYNFYLNDGAGVSDVYWDFQGPGVKLTSNMSYGEEVSENWVEVLQPNSTYTYQDDSRPGNVWTLQTNNTTASAATQTPAPVAPPLTSTNQGTAPSTDLVGSAKPKATTLRGTLVAKITAAGVVSLSFKGKAVSSLKSGKYTLKVTDQDKKDGFTIRAIKATPIAASGVGFVGTRSVKLTMAAGQWMYYASLGTKPHAFIVTN